MWSIIFSNQYPLIILFIWQHPLLAHTNPLRQFWNPNSPYRITSLLPENTWFYSKLNPNIFFIIFSFYDNQKDKFLGQVSGNDELKSMLQSFNCTMVMSNQVMDSLMWKQRCKEPFFVWPKIWKFMRPISPNSHAAHCLVFNLGRTINGPVDRMVCIQTHSMKSQWVCVYAYKE